MLVLEPLARDVLELLFERGELLDVREGLKAVDARRGHAKPEGPQDSSDLTDRVLRLVRIKHLVAEPRTDELVVARPAIDLSVSLQRVLELGSREPAFVLNRAVIGEIVEERAPH